MINEKISEQKEITKSNISQKDLLSTEFVKIPTFEMPTITIGESIGKMMKEIAGEMNPWKEIAAFQSDTIAKSMDFALNANKQIAEIFKSYNNVANLNKIISDSFVEPLKKISEAVMSISIQNEKWKEIFQDFLKEDKRRENIIKNSGWFFSPSLMVLYMHDLNEVIYEIESGNKDAIFMLSKKYFSKNKFENLNFAVERWQKNEYFKKREKLINEAIYCHKKKYYSASISLFLSILEGVAGDFCQDNPQSKVRSNSSDSKRKIDKSFELSSIGKEILYGDAIFISIDSYIYANTSKLKQGDSLKSAFSGILNRHGILHGNIVDYGTEENSYKCILLLDIFSLLKYHNEKKKTTKKERTQ